GYLAAQWSVAGAAVAGALDDPDRSARTVGGMFGEQPFESLVGRLLCADTLFHTWDLARATGQDEHLDEGAVAAAMTFLEPIDETIRRPGGFAPKLPPPPGADAQVRLLCFGGRQTAK
ncbi:MAG: TIGR03086 family metal-binding protein, partial [Acidimicrobiales bacterium]